MIEIPKFDDPVKIKYENFCQVEIRLICFCISFLYYFRCQCRKETGNV